MPPPPFRPLSTLPDYRPVRMSRDFLAPWITHQPQLQVTLLSRMQRVKSWSELKYTKCNKSWKIFSGQNGPLQILSGELNCNYLRSWISAWRDRRRAKWPVTLWRAGTEHQRSYSTGCTTVRQVTILPSLMQAVFRGQFVIIQQNIAVLWQSITFSLLKFSLCLPPGSQWMSGRPPVSWPRWLLAVCFSQDMTVSSRCAVIKTAYAQFQ